MFNPFKHDPVWFEHMMETLGTLNSGTPMGPIHFPIPTPISKPGCVGQVYGKLIGGWGFLVLGSVWGIPEYSMILLMEEIRLTI